MIIKWNNTINEKIIFIFKLSVCETYSIIKQLPGGEKKYEKIRNQKIWD